jgi:hypothetical protein
MLLNAEYNDEGFDGDFEDPGEEFDGHLELHVPEEEEEDVDMSLQVEEEDVHSSDAEDN